MALGLCIPDMVAAGKLTGDRAKRAAALYDELLSAERGKWGEDAAASMATQKVLAVLEKEFAQKKRVTMLAASAQGRWLADMRRAAGDGPFDPVRARRLLERLDKRVDAVRNSHLSGFDKLLERHRRNLLGEVRHRDDLTLILRERFAPGSTGDDNAREMADAMGQVMDALRARRNAAGGNTAKLDDFIFPQAHDSRLVRALGDYAAWRALPEIDRARVRDVETGEWATGLRRETILRGAWESITTDGANSSKPGAVFAGSMANQRNDPRVIHFADADDWMAYQQQFSGVDNIYDLFIGHVSAMSREIVLMEAMGPNPNAMLRFQQDWIEKSMRQSGTQDQIDGTLGRKGIKGHQQVLADTFDELTGANKVPGSRGLALTFSGGRALQVSAKLGSAVLSAVPDMATLLKTARYNRIPMMKTVGRYAKMWTPGNVEDRALAVRLGLVTDDWINLSSASYRYTGEELTGEVTRRMADFVLRAQGLSRHTRNAQWAFGMEFAGHLTAMRDRGFDNLDPALQRQMARYDISPRDWDAYRKTKPVTERGAEWIIPEQVEDRLARERVMEMILAETDYGIIMPDIRTRTQLNSQLRPGTWIGEIGRSAFLFKSFPLAILNLHGARAMQQPGWNKAIYGTSLILAMSAAGALSVQLKMLAAGKDPQPMDEPEFIAKAVIQSGGLGIFGDLLYNSTNSFGGGMLSTLAGPLLGQTVPNIGQLTVGNAARALDGDEETETRVGRDLTKLLRSEVPGSNLWYVRQAYQRLLMDRVQSMVDDDADDFFDRQMKRAEDEGTAFFLPPGATPDEARLPDFANAVAGDE
jgi:hypothetical protein